MRKQPHEKLRLAIQRHHEMIASHRAHAAELAAKHDAERQALADALDDATATETPPPADPSQAPQ